eukprot:scaffold43920_cov69-Phaeocystis_antarctica.AAC.6
MGGRLSSPSLSWVAGGRDRDAVAIEDEGGGKSAIPQPPRSARPRSGGGRAAAARADAGWLGATPIPQPGRSG